MNSRQVHEVLLHRPAGADVLQPRTLAQVQNQPGVVPEVRVHRQPLQHVPVPGLETFSLFFSENRIFQIGSMVVNPRNEFENALVYL
jgi:hypothetical protein